MIRHRSSAIINRGVLEKTGIFIGSFGLFLSFFFVVDGGLHLEEGILTATLVGILALVSARRYRSILRFVFPAFVMFTAGFWITAYLVLTNADKLPVRQFKPDDYSLAHSIRQYPDIAETHALKIIEQIKVIYDHHPEQFPSVAVAEMQLLRKMASSEFVKKPFWRRWIRQQCAKNWKKTIYPAVQATWFDVKYICQQSGPWYLVPITAVTCMHEYFDYRRITAQLNRPPMWFSSYPSFEHETWQAFVRHLYQYEKSPILHELVFREGIMFYRIARKLHMWRRIVYILSHGSEAPVPVDPFSPENKPFAVRGCRIFSEANYVYNRCSHQGEQSVRRQKGIPRRSTSG